MQFKALLLAGVLAATPLAAAAQVVSRPEREPARVAGQEAWYLAGEPVMHRGERFYPAGALVFFNATVMVHAGEYRGVPVYVDPTVETGSIIYVPIGNGQMKPYERLRDGDLAGTSGSRTPSFPPETASALREESVAVGTAGVMPPQPPVGDLPLARAAAGATTRSNVVTIAPAGTTRGRGMWIEWNGQSWRAAGAAVRVGPQFVPIGTINGRTVYRGPDGSSTIWLETVQGLASPWRR